MALTTKEISIVLVTQVMIGQFSITWNLKGFDELGVELFSEPFSEDYKTGDPINRVKNGFTGQMQSYIDKYKKEQQILNAPAHTSAVSDVLSTLVL